MKDENDTLKDRKKEIKIHLQLQYFLLIITLHCGPGSSSGKALVYGLDGPGSIPGVGGVRIFLLFFVSRLVLGSTQPSIKLVPGAFPEGKGGRT